MWSWLKTLRARVIDARTAPRAPAQLQAAVLAIDGQSHCVRLIDFSESGAMVESDVVLREGAEVTLQVLDRELLRGQVRWSRGGRIGLKFDQSGQGPRKYREES